MEKKFKGNPALSTAEAVQLAISALQVCRGLRGFPGDLGPNLACCWPSARGRCAAGPWESVGRLGAVVTAGPRLGAGGLILERRRALQRAAGLCGHAAPVRFPLTKAQSAARCAHTALMLRPCSVLCSRCAMLCSTCWRIPSRLQTHSELKLNLYSCVACCTHAVLALMPCCAARTGGGPQGGRQFLFKLMHSCSAFCECRAHAVPALCFPAARAGGGPQGGGH